MTGRVSPWTTRVPMTVVNVRNSTRLRAGNASPSLVTMGMEKAMASETTPRIPAQPTISGEVQLVSGSRSLMRFDSRRGT